MITDLGIGGAENQVQALSQRLSAKGWGVAIVSMMSPAIMTEHLTDAGVLVEHLGMGRGSWNPWAVAKLRRIIRQRRPRLIHSHMVHANLLARLTKPLSGMPVLICTSHNVNEGGLLRTWAIRLTDRLADRTTHVSKVGLSKYLRTHIVAPDRAVWIPNGVDVLRFESSPGTRSRVRSELGLSDDTFLWLTVGSLSPQKDHNRLIRAFSQITGDTVLVIAGDGPLRSQLEQWVRDSHGNSRIRFVGSRTDPEALMNAADGFVLSSRWEGLPLVLIEAAAARLPIVSTDVGGCREIVENERSGLLVDSGEPENLALSMRKLMTLSPSELTAMGRRGRELVEARYAIDRVVGEWERLYESVGCLPPARASAAGGS